MQTFAEETKAIQPAMSAIAAESPIPDRPHSAEGRGPSAILNLQRTIGNQAVQRLLNANAARRKAEAGGARSAAKPPKPPVVLQRKCSCEGTGGGCAACAEEKESTVQRDAADHDEPSGVLQRQTGDPFADPLGEKDKPKVDPATARVNQACGTPAGKFPWVEIAPDIFFLLKDDTPLMLPPPDVVTSGCFPGRLANVALFSGSPAWQMPTGCDTCKVTGTGSKAGSTAGIQVGYIQTVEKCLSGGVYFQQDPTGKWVPAGNDWVCVDNTRDGFAASTAPWAGPDPNGNFGPQPFGSCPAFADHPYVKLPNGQNVVKTGGVDRPQWPLRRMRIDGIFHTWLVAQAPNSPLVYIHHWSFQCWVVSELSDDADPCNKTGWQTMNMNKLLTSGPGKGSATPVLTGGIANNLKKKC
ncbi:MAG TPA: hypothetical protein VFE33_34700 [Thermoanaerobaculia bacterium]|nr:hypothetical protein [Thermoanaerobaculia bacterium]